MRPVSKVSLPFTAPGTRARTIRATLGSIAIVAILASRSELSGTAFARSAETVGASLKIGMPQNRSCPAARVRGTTGLNGHLFVVGAASGEALRYTIIDGTPQKPDLQFSPVYLRTAVDGMGNFYTQMGYTTGNIGVYPPGHSRLSRIIEPSVPGATEVGTAAIAADKNGYFYYAYNAQFRHGVHSGILVYAPGASGNAQPVQSIPLGHGYLPAHPFGMAIGPSGDLFVIGGRNQTLRVVVYSDVLSHPRMVRTITGAGLSDPRGITVDESGELYVTNQAQDDIVVYARDAHGRANPIRTMTIKCLVGINGGAVLLGNDGFVADGPSNTIVEFDKRLPGLQNPIRIVPTLKIPVSLSIGAF